MHWLPHAWMPHRHLRFQVALIDKFDVEDQVGFGGNGSRTSAHAIRKLPGDEEPPLSADLHAREALVESGDQASEPLRETERLGIAHLWLAGRVKLGLSFLIHDRSSVVIGRVE